MVVASVRVNMLCQVSSTIASAVITKNWLVTHQMAPAVSIIKIFDDGFLSGHLTSFRYLRTLGTLRSNP